MGFNDFDSDFGLVLSVLRKHNFAEPSFTKLLDDFVLGKRRVGVELFSGGIEESGVGLYEFEVILHDFDAFSVEQPEVIQFFLELLGNELLDVREPGLGVELEVHRFRWVSVFEKY